MTQPARGSYLDPREAVEYWGRTLIQHLALAHKVREVYESIAALCARESGTLDRSGQPAPELAFVPSMRRTWAWLRFSELAPTANGSVLRPDDLDPDKPGRWVEQVLPHYVAGSNLAQYLRHVEFVDHRIPVFGKPKEANLWDRCRGKTPALFVSCLQDESENTTQTFAYAWFSATYRLRVISANWRGATAAEWGSPVSEEEAAEPGTARIIGDLRWYLTAENTLGHARGLNEVQHGRRVPDNNVHENRMVSDYMDITLVGSVYVPSEPYDYQDPWRIWVQVQDELGRQAVPPFEVRE